MKIVIRVILIILFAFLIVLSIYNIERDTQVFNRDKIYAFEEATGFLPEDSIKYGVNVFYLDGHESDYLEVAMNNFREIENFEVFVDDGTLIIIVDEKKSGERKDRVYMSKDASELKDIFETVEVYRNGRKYFFVSTSFGVE